MPCPVHSLPIKAAPASLLCKLPGVWRGSDLGPSSAAVQPTSWAPLDRALPGGGWPAGALTELLTLQPATLEWRLLGPALKAVAAQGREIVLIAPPRQPFLPGLQQLGLDERRLVWIQADPPAERLWAAEQMIKSNACGAIIAWLPQVRPESVRRLQVCAQSGDALVFACRLEAARHESSAAPLRVLAHPDMDWALRVHIIKRRGPTLDEPLTLPSIPAGLADIITPRLRQPSRLRPAQPEVLTHYPEVPTHAMGRPVPAAQPRSGEAVR